MISKISSNFVMDLPGSSPGDITGFTRNVTGTATALFSSSTPCLSVVLIGKSTNTQPVYFGGSDAQYMYVKPDEMICISISDASKVYFKGTSGDVLQGHLFVQ